MKVAQSADSAKQSSTLPRHRGRSLLRLVLLGFAVAMLPVMVLIYQAGQAISELSALADSSARQAVDDTRRARALINLTSEMERAARQYEVLEEPQLLDVYRDRMARFEQLFDLQVARLGSLGLENPLRGLLAELREFPELERDQQQALLARFPAFAGGVDELGIVTNNLVDTRLEAMRERAGAIYSDLWLKLAVTLALTLAAILFFTWRIIRPIRQLERRILSLGSHRRESVEEIKGPAELVALGRRLDWLGERLDELEAQKRTFLRHMSHELKTPLAAIREGTGLLADGIVGSLGKRQREIVLLIDDSSAELQTLIEQLLDYNLVQHNRTLTVTRFDVVTLIHEVIGKHRLAFESKGLSLDVPRRPVYWQADRVRTGRIIDNLISNVIAYGADNGSLWVRAWNDERMLYVEVANSGERISEQDRDHLFEPFYQGRIRRKGPLKGSGIGLSVAAESAAIQHGSLVLVDDAEEDVCFRLTLPMADAGQRTQPIEPAARAADEGIAQTTNSSG